MPDNAQPHMVVLGRQARGLRQSDLARLLGVSGPYLSRIEGGIRPVSPDLLAKLSQVLDYPSEFFYQTDSLLGFGTSELFHRRKQDLSNRTLDMVHAQINLRRIHLKRLLQNVEIGEPTVPIIDLDEFDGDVERIAQAVRSVWGVPRGPVANLTGLLEAARAIVVTFDFGTTRIDAISQWPLGMPPLLFVDAIATADRARMSLAHELAHIVMHQRSPNPDMEREAYRFAAEFLMPAKEIRSYLTAPITLEKVANLKGYWKVSMAALLKRASDLGTLSPRQAKSLWSRMSRLGYRLREPVELDIDRETPTLFQEILDVHRNQLSFDVDELSKVVHLFPDETRRTYLGAGGGRLKLVC